jgi:hypothetical protein
MGFAVRMFAVQRLCAALLQRSPSLFHMIV